MKSRLAGLFAATLALAFSSGAARAQLNDNPSGFYADPVLPDPPAAVAHVYPAATATADVAAVADAAGLPLSRSRDAKAAPAACTLLSPCAVPAPAARSAVVARNP